MLELGCMKEVRRLKTYEICSNCLGKKVVMGMGCMEQDCDECDGSGQTSKPVVEIKSAKIEKPGVGKQRIKKDQKKWKNIGI